MWIATQPSEISTQSHHQSSQLDEQGLMALQLQALAQGLVQLTNAYEDLRANMHYHIHQK